MDVSFIKVMQTITINSNNNVNVSVLENEIQNRLGPPFNNIPLKFCIIQTGSVIEKEMDVYDEISRNFY